MPESSLQQSLSNASLRKLIWGLAIPNIVSNITVPLLSLVDVGLAGNMAVYGSIGAWRSPLSWSILCTGCLAFFVWGLQVL
ncbi:hypothetical protein [Porphyromonas gingivicanis]|uniref:hypothetical protein n=1 Tax=Porphyromonas gingivicanis TaxID=266762 RepID=UPI001F57C9B5|nr:hypothetical protein [Porphyromonas gingivicanis]